MVSLPSKGVNRTRHETEATIEWQHQPSSLAPSQLDLQTILLEPTPLITIRL